ncbi:SMI1/KNR4 family protein, partial [Providencia rettgeri]
MTIELVFPEKSLSNDELNQFELLFIAKLPEAFKQHYLTINGGFIGENSNVNSYFGGFNPIKYGKLPIEKLIEDIGDLDVILNNKSVHYEQGSFIPFGYDNGGNTLLLSLKKDSYGEVYF